MVSMRFSFFWDVILHWLVSANQCCITLQKNGDLNWLHVLACVAWHHQTTKQSNDGSMPYSYMYTACSFCAYILHTRLQYKSIDPKLITVKIIPAFYKIIFITVIEAPRYKSEGHGFDSGWCHWNFSLTWSFRPHYGPGVTQPLTEMSTRNISWE
jgi:hypothetical protein